MYSYDDRIRAVKLYIKLGNHNDLMNSEGGCYREFLDLQTRSIS